MGRRMNYYNIDLKDMDNAHFLIGLLNAMMNNFQTVGDTFFEEMSWKQCFVMICIGLFEEPPTLKELSELMGSSHQNVKKMVEKLEKNGYISVQTDEQDRRKQRLQLTQKTADFNKHYSQPSEEFMQYLFGGIDRNELEVTVKTLMTIDRRLKEYKMKG